MKDKEKKNKVIIIRVATAEFEKIKELAKSKGLTMSEYIRSLALAI